MILLLPRLIRLGVKLVMLPVVVALVYLAATAVQVYQASLRDQAAPAQAILVLGAAQYDGRPSPDLVARLDHAYDLWQRGYAKVIALTGGGRPGDRFTEAQAGQSYLAGRGVPGSDIVVNDAGSDSWLSMVGAAEQLRKLHDTRVILVSDPFHNARVAGMASALSLDGLVSPTRTSPIRGTATIPYFAKEAAAVAVGRVVGYPRLSGLSRSLRLVRAALPGG